MAVGHILVRTSNNSRYQSRWTVGVDGGLLLYGAWVSGAITSQSAVNDSIAASNGQRRATIHSSSEVDNSSYL